MVSDRELEEALRLDRWNFLLAVGLILAGLVVYMRWPPGGLFLISVGVYGIITDLKLTVKHKIR